MVEFKYEGFDKTGTRVIGSIEANDQKDAKRLLRRKGIRAKKLAKPNIFSEMNISDLLADLNISSGFSEKDIGRFTKQLATLVNAGVPILQSIEILQKQEKNPYLRKSLLRISRRISEGQTLSDSMQEDKNFSKLYCQLIKAGEVAGILDEILNKLDDFLEKKMALRKKIKSAMMYPAIVSFIGVIVFVGLMTFVVPQFVSMLEENQQEIPWITQVVINISDFFRENIFKLIIGSIAFFFGAYYFLRKTEDGRRIFDKAILQIPVLGNVIIKGNLSSFSQTLATMISSGISIVDALEVCADTVENSIISRDIKRVRASVVSGRTLAAPLGRITYFPDLITQMINVGESTGNLDEMLKKVSKVFEVEVEGSVQSMTQLIEPILIVVLAVLVGGVLAAMYMPIFAGASGVA